MYLGAAHYLIGSKWTGRKREEVKEARVKKQSEYRKRKHESHKRENTRKYSNVPKEWMESKGKEKRCGKYLKENCITEHHGNVWNHSSILKKDARRNCKVIHGRE